MGVVSPVIRRTFYPRPAHRYDRVVVSTPSLGQRTGSEIGRELGGRYRLVAPIGIGTSSRVFMAVDTRLRRTVAVKVLHASLAADDAFLRRFRAEARAAAALSHPNILAVYDWGEDETGDGVAPFIVTEYLGGGSLRRILDRGRPLSPSQALMIGLDTTRALAHAHRRGLIHRDVKPANLLFDTQGRLRLADFGIARALAEAAWTEPTGAMLGTARYASPEQALGHRLDGRSDVYSLALVLVECVTGEVPFVGDTTTATLALRTRSDLVVPDELGHLRPALLRAGRLDPHERVDADGLAIALSAAAEQLPRPAPLPLVATIDEAEVTAELRLLDGWEGVGALSHADASERTAPEDGRPTEPDGAVDDDDAAADGDGAFGRSPIVVAEEHHLLSASRPVSFGRVEPFVSEDGPAGNTLDPQTGAGSAPPPRRRSRRSLAVVGVVVAAAAAAGWWFVVRVPSAVVPDLVGSDVAEARAAARAHRWRLDDGTVVRVDGTRSGQVVGQTPTAGASLAEGSTLRVKVSLGPPLVAVPAVAGVTQGDATAAIEAAGLRVGTVDQVHDEAVPAGSVVSAGPAPGQEAPAADGTVPKGTLLALVVSSGPAPRAVPDGLMGIPVADARTRLAAVQLGAEVRDDYSSTVPAGIVASVGTPAGTEVPRGTPVVLVVSKGPAPIPIPDVIGQSGTSAAAALQAAGFGVSGIEGSPSNAVLATDPPAGEPHQVGTAVRIFTRR